MKTRNVFAVTALSFLLATPVLADGGRYADSARYYDYAKVTDARPVYEVVQVSMPRTVCRDRYISRDAQAPRSYTGVITGGIIGGVIGNQVVHGKYRDWGTVAGALLGGSIGNDISQRKRAEGYGTSRDCREITDVREERQLTGYEVAYRYRGRDYVTFMDHDPGHKVRVSVRVDIAE
ncbi:MAG: glycine zipper 2TM domain-containing protein [Gammaproteobacteria bacterium]|nr:glycine zipper 2TM domain-containing protein [Gammaproteobacteria bacterium]